MSSWLLLCIFCYLLMSLYCLCVHYYRLVVRLCSSIYLLLQGPDSHCSFLWDLLLWQLLLALLVLTPNVLNAPRSTFYFQMPPRRSVRQKRPSSQALEALSPGQTIATCQRNISQHCWAQHVACVWRPCCDMLGIVSVLLGQV